MSPETTDILERALTLTVDDRAKLIARLLETLEGDDSDVEAAWNTEIARRIADLDSGAVSAVPWDEARQRIRGG